MYYSANGRETKNTTIMYKYNSTMDLTQSTNLIYINHITILTWGTPKPLDIPSSKENQE